MRHAVQSLSSLLFVSFLALLSPMAGQCANLMSIHTFLHGDLIETVYMAQLWHSLQPWRWPQRNGTTTLIPSPFPPSRTYLVPFGATQFLFQCSVWSQWKHVSSLTSLLLDFKLELPGLLLSLPNLLGVPRRRRAMAISCLYPRWGISSTLLQH